MLFQWKDFMTFLISLWGIYNFLVPICDLFSSDFQTQPTLVLWPFPRFGYAEKQVSFWRGGNQTGTKNGTKTNHKLGNFEQISTLWKFECTPSISVLIFSFLKLKNRDCNWYGILMYQKFPWLKNYVTIDSCMCKIVNFILFLCC